MEKIEMNGQPFVIKDIITGKSYLVFPFPQILNINPQASDIAIEISGLTEEIQTEHKKITVLIV